ncbi:MAG: 4Fe-4S dicluster domain-containing protein [Thermodesulfobacteriota bacterium]|jgi:heterodisulfide reductase subunit C|nr:MAG: 4Fe-4S dicluster domain-containing protein [Thermodesulfobacteriota bacterium]
MSEQTSLEEEKSQKTNLPPEDESSSRGFNSLAIKPLRTENKPWFEPKPFFLKEVESLSREKVSVCYQCRKCSNGCPVTFAMDFLPNQLMHAIKMGLRDEILGSSTPWVCASCQTCTTRCPNDIDIAHVMDTLRQLSVQEKTVNKERNAPIFHQVFLDSIWRRGRVYELGMLQTYALKSGDFKDKMAKGELMNDLKLGWAMLTKGKLPLLPKSIRRVKEVRNIFKKTKSR